MRSAFLLGMTALLFTASADSARLDAGARAKDTFIDADGRKHTLFRQPGQKAAVLFFLMPDCPISNAYAPEIRRICASYAPKQVAAYIVHADPDVTAATARRHAKEYGLTCPLLLDPAHVLVRRGGASKAPEAVVFDAAGAVVYRGRIDDWYVDYGKRRGAPTRRDLRAALDAVLAGRAVTRPVTEVIGCDLPEARKHPHTQGTAP